MTNALVYHEFFRHSDKVGLAVARGGMGLMATEVYGDPVGPRMVRLVMKALHDHFAGALPVAVTGNSPQTPLRGLSEWTPRRAPLEVQPTRWTSLPR